MHRTIAFLASIALTTLAVGSACLAADPGQLRFTIEPDNRPGTVQLSMREQWDGRNSNWSSPVPLAELQGLQPSQLQAGGPVRFALVREAGRFDCSGTGGNSGALGSCGFTPDAGFSSFLAGRGIGNPDRDQSYSLAMGKVGRAHVDALAANRYPTPTIRQLVAMGIHGASPAFVQDIAAAGYRGRSIDDLIAFRIHGVDGRFMRGMAAAGPQFQNLDGDDLVAFRIHNVSPELMAAFGRLGYRNLGRKDVVSMAIHGVTPQFIEELARLGYRNLDADELVQLRIFGVTPEYIRALGQDGVNRPSAAQLVKLRIAGYQPR